MPASTSTDITWGVNGKGRRALFCMRCREVFGRELDAVTVRELKQKVEGEHKCKRKN